MDYPAGIVLQGEKDFQVLLVTGILRSWRFTYEKLARNRPDCVYLHWQIALTELLQNPNQLVPPTWQSQRRLFKRHRKVKRQLQGLTVRLEYPIFTALSDILPQDRLQTICRILTSNFSTCDPAELSWPFHGGKLLQNFSVHILFVVLTPTHPRVCHLMYTVVTVHDASEQLGVSIQQIFKLKGR